MTEMKLYMADRRKYERPTMRVVEIQQRGLLMTSGTRNPYGDPTNWDWD